MSMIFHPSVPIGIPSPWMGEEDSMATRVRMVLETPKGHIPWRPEFGCDLDGLVGEAATSRLLTQAQARIEAALERWLPELTIDAVRVFAVPSSDHRNTMGHREVPIAEAALLTVGVQASLHVELELTGPDGPAVVSTTLDP
jgi:phage baseplate assembly protein W